MTGDDELLASLAMVCGPALAVGCLADLVVVDCLTLREAVTQVPPRLATFKRGRCVVRTEITRTWGPSAR